MKLIKFTAALVIVILALVAGVLFLAQSDWAKDKIGLVIQETALQQGVRLKIEKIDGELPLKWTISGIELQLENGDSIAVEEAHVRIALLPLLRKHLTISYFDATHIIYRYLPHETTPSGRLKLPSFTLRRASIQSLKIIDLQSGDEATYGVEGSCKIVKNGKLFDLSTKITSQDLDLRLLLQGDKKSNQISADLKLDVKSKRAFAPIEILPIETAFRLETVCAGPWRVWKTLFYPSSDAIYTKPVIGDLKLEIEKLALPELKGLDESSTLVAHFSLLSNRMFHLSSLSFKSDLLCIKGNAQFNGSLFPRTLQGTFLVPHLSRLIPEVEGLIKGKIDYTPEVCRIEATSDRIDVRQVTFTNVALDANAAFKDLWIGNCLLVAHNSELALKGNGAFEIEPHDRLTLKDLSIEAPQTLVTGDIGIDLRDYSNLSGGVAFQISDLSLFTPLSPIELSGQIGGVCRFEKNGVSCRGAAKDLRAGQFLTQELDFNLYATDLMDEIKGTLAVETHQAVWDELFIESFHGSLGWEMEGWLYAFEAAGEWKKPYDIRARGRIAKQFDEISFDLLTGKVLGKSIDLQNRVVFSCKSPYFTLSDLSMRIDEGEVHGSIDYQNDGINIHFQATHFPLDFITLISPRLSLLGYSSADIDITGNGSSLEGHCNLLLEQANIFPAGLNTPIQTKGSLQINLKQGMAQIHSHLVATEEQFLELSGAFPFRFELNPLRFQIVPDKPLAGKCTVEGHIEQLLDFINLGTQRIGGFLSTHLLLSGTLEKPTLFGPISLQGGFYHNYFIGMSINGVNAEAMAQGEIVIANGVVARDDGKGSSLSNAIFHLKPNLPFKIEGSIDHFRVIQFDWLTAHCSGPFKITGSLERGLAQGTLTVDDAEISIPEQLPADLPTLPVTFVNQPESYVQPEDLQKESYPFHYDLKIHGEDNIVLSGRGLHAELIGDLQITGKNLTVSAVGALQTKKGQFSFAGKDFNITQGELTFSESQTFLNIVSTLDMPDLTATVTFRGALTSPELIFQSNPPLSTGALLARILFNKDVSELSASQALQLADTILTLSGGAGPNVMETIRNNLGIDRLSISASEETGEISVQVGKKIAKGVMITLTQGTETSHVLVEVELKGGFVLSAETQEDNQGKFTFKWNKNY